MQSFNTCYSNYYQLSKYVKEHGIDGHEQVLAQIFTGRTDVDFAHVLIKEIKNILPQAHIIGTTTAGEIMNCKVLSDTTVLSFSVFENTKLTTAIIHEADGDFALGYNLGKTLARDNTKVMIVFGNAKTINGSDMLEGIENTGTYFKIAGGHAGNPNNNGYFNDTFVFTEQGITSKGIVGVSLNSDILHVFNEYNLCWQGIGKVMTVTKASKNKIYEIDNINILETYKKYLGENVAHLLPESATEFPLIVLKDGMKIARCPILKHADGSLEFIGNIEEGAKVSFSYGNINMLICRSSQIMELISKRNLESVFLYSCLGRRLFMQERIEDEFIPLKNIPSVSGFFTYGEYYQTPHKNNVLLNITTTLLGLSESPSTARPLVKKSFLNELPKTDFVKGKREIIIEVLNNLINAVAGELEKINNDLQKKNDELSKANKDMAVYAETIKENQNALIEIEKVASLGHLIGGIAHNLKTPIMTSSGGVSILKSLTQKLLFLSESLPNASEFSQVTDEINDWLDEIRASLHYMSEVMSTVKGQAGEAPQLSKETFEIDELIRKITILMNHELKRNTCTLKTKIETKTLTKISGNIHDLIQVLNVLISNTIDAYGNRGGIVELIIKKNEATLKIEVIDYAGGINEKIADKIFKEMVTTKGKNGMGLGLYISHTIIKGRFRGNIGFDSCKGKGTVFWLTIPLKQ